LLILLAEREGELVTRDEIVERLWGKDVYLEADRGINTAVSKLRLALRDDPERPRFVQTVVGKGYRLKRQLLNQRRSYHQLQNR
jgi:DNA-binding winged helix-turn-helix (wHTH) protein